MKTVLQIVPCKGWGGGERYVCDLTQQLQYRGDNVVVVASNVGGQVEIIENGVDGFLFKKGDSKALAGQFQRLIDNRDLLLNVGATAIDKFQRKFSYKKFANEASL